MGAKTRDRARLQSLSGSAAAPQRAARNEPGTTAIATCFLFGIPRHKVAGTGRDPDPVLILSFTPGEHRPRSWPPTPSATGRRRSSPFAAGTYAGIGRGTDTIRAVPVAGAFAKGELMCDDAHCALANPSQAAFWEPAWPVQG